MCVARPAVASSIDPNSMTLVQIVTWRLLKWSASQPPGMLKRINGTENRKVTTEIKLSRWACAMFIPMTIERRRLRRMLSLKAPWNCVAMSAQNPRRLRGAVVGETAGSAAAGSLETVFIGEVSKELRGLRGFAQFYPKYLGRGSEPTQHGANKVGRIYWWAGGS